MSRDRKALKETLADKAIETIAAEGLENLSLRRVAALASVTTAAIVHHFGNKAGLQAAAIALALERERAFHDDVLARRVPKVGFLSFADEIADYILLRSSMAMPKFWLEMLYKRTSMSVPVDALREWTAVRLEFWRSLLVVEGVDPGLAELIVPYLCMEEVFAISMKALPHYSLLLRETVRSLVRKSFVPDLELDEDSLVATWLDSVPRDSMVSDWLDTVLDSGAKLNAHDPDSIPERLIQQAASEILQHGVDSINQRKLARLANTSASMITYHFGGKSAFDIHVIWRAMVMDLPLTMDVRPDNSTKITFEQWSKDIAALIRPRVSDSRAGFYLSYARMTGEIALMASQRSDLLPLAAHLRSIDGRNTFQTSQFVWKDPIPLTRSGATAFSVWSKGVAVLNDALQEPQAKVPAMLRDAMGMIVGTKVGRRRILKS